MPNITRIPILLLTGFLGSGKTTLLRSLLTGPDAADTAVIVNEFGEVGLDHHLLLGASETMFVLENGCVCCSVRDDLAASFEELFWQRMRREIPRFNRVVVETTGLAEPARVLDLFRDGSVAAERFEWAAIAATIDGLTGMATIDRHPEAFLQATGADTLIITKTDLAPRDAIDALDQRLRLLNPTARIVRSAKGEQAVPLNTLMQPTRSSSERKNSPPLTVQGNPPTFVASCWLRFISPVVRADFETAFTAMLARFGTGVVRAKGLVEFAGDEAMAVVQYVDGSNVEIDANALAKDKTRSSGLVVFTTGVDDHALAGIFTDTGITVEHGDTHAHHHHDSAKPHTHSHDEA